MFADQNIPYLSENRARMPYGKRNATTFYQKRLGVTNPSVQKDKSELIKRGEEHRFLKTYTIYIVVTAIISLFILSTIG